MDCLEITEETGYFFNIKCHERPITDTRFNSDGDLIFTCGKDALATVLRSDGSILGCFRKHDGSLFSLSVNSDSTTLVTSSADQTLIQWDVERGKPLNQVSTNGIVKGTEFIDNSDCCLVCSDNTMNKKPYVGIYDPNSGKVENIFDLNNNPTKIVPDNTGNRAVYSDTDGHVYQIDLRNNVVLLSCQVHTSKINSLRSSRCRSFFVTASVDAQAKIIDFDSLGTQKTFICEEPINCAVIFNTNDKLLCVGGIDAVDVTTTRGKTSFDANFFDVVTTEKVGVYTTHFGTINCADVHPSGLMYCSGGEEGTLCILNFGKDFAEAGFINFN